MDCGLRRFFTVALNLVLFIALLRGGRKILAFRARRGTASVPPQSMVENAPHRFLCARHVVRASRRNWGRSVGNRRRSCLLGQSDR